MADNKSTGTGVGFTGLLTLVFIVLKLTKSIDWSWWWVLSPLWIVAVIVMLAIIAYAIIETRKKEPEANTKSAWQRKVDEMAERTGGK